MEVNLGDFKSIFVVASLYGTNTVSTRTLEQSKSKIIYAAGLITLYTAETVIYLCNTTQEPLLAKVLNICMSILPVYALIMAIVDYKSRISVALNLISIETKLERNNIPVPRKRMINIMTVIVWLLNTIMVGLNIMISFSNENFNFPITKSVTNIHRDGIQLIEWYLLIVFLSKLRMIQKSITKAFKEVTLSTKEIQPLASRSHRQRCRGRTNRRVQTEVGKKWALYAELQGSLFNTEHMICNSFWVQTIWLRMVVEVAVPFVSSIRKFNGPGYFLLIRMALKFVGILYIWESVKKEKLASISTENLVDISTTSEINWERISRRKIKHQLLAKIHRHRVSFCCRLFDVDFSLLATVLENVVFVITATIGNSTNNI